MSRLFNYESMVGSVVAGRYKLVHIIARGYLGVVYEAYDTLGQRFVVKVFADDDALDLSTYIYHLQLVHKALAESDSTGLLLPEDVGKGDGFFFEVYKFIVSEDLGSFIRERAPLDPRYTMVIVAKIAQALQILHSHSIIHADVKPTNILIQLGLSPDEMQIYLTDLGMVRVGDSQDSVVLVSTYDYMHPSLRGPLRSVPKTDLVRYSMRAPAIGPYIDIYALGVVTFQMLTSPSPEAYPASEEQLVFELRKRNSWFSCLSGDLGDRLARLLSAMIFIEPSQEITMLWIYQEASSLAKELPHISAIPAVHTTTVQYSQAPKKIIAKDSDVEQILARLESISQSLTEASTVFLSKGRSLSIPEDSMTDHRQLSEISAAFSNMLKRNKNVWMITAIMTIVGFSLFVSMIVLAVVMAVSTGKSWWALLFGSASVPLIIGTLIWRPFDRMFRSTILTQQLEMIHIQTVAAFTATQDVDQRVKICQEAFNKLTVLFDKHAIPEERKTKSKQ
jgi:serine/threonine protein kinase